MSRQGKGSELTAAVYTYVKLTLLGEALDTSYSKVLHTSRLFLQDRQWCNQLLQRCLCLFSKATGERWQWLPLASDLLLGRKRCEHAMFSVISLQLRISWGTFVFGLVEPIFRQETSVSETSFVPNWQKQKKPTFVHGLLR